MESARNAVSGILGGRSGMQTTDVDESVNPAVTSETIKPTRHEETVEAIDREVHQDHYHTTIQPVAHKEVLPEQHVQNVVPQVERSFQHGDIEADRSRAAADLGQFQNTSTIGETTQSVSAAPTAIGEHTHHHVHEVVQPVIHKETIQPEVVHTTIPIHETHHAPSEHHGLSMLPVRTLDEMQGVVGGGHSSHTEYEGHPKPYNRSMQANPTDVDLHPERHEGEHDPEKTGHFSGYGGHSHDSGTTGATGGIAGLSGTSGTTDTSGIGGLGHSGTDRSHGIEAGVGGAALGAGAGAAASGLGHHGDSTSRGTSDLTSRDTPSGIAGAGSGSGFTGAGTGPGSFGGSGLEQSMGGLGLGNQTSTGGYGNERGLGDQSLGGGYGNERGLGDQTSTGGYGSSAAMGSGIGGVAAGSAAQDLGRDHTRAHEATGIDARDSAGGILGDSGSGTAGTALGGRTEGNTGDRAASAARGALGEETGHDTTTRDMTDTHRDSGAEQIGSSGTRSEHREGNAHRGPNDAREPSNLTGGDAEPKRDISGDDDVQHASKIGEDPSIAKRGDGKLTGTGEPGSHSAVFGLTPDGKKYDDTKSTTTKMPQREEDEREDNEGQGTGSRGTGGAGVADQMHDPRVAEKGHEGKASYGPSDGGDDSVKPGAGVNV